MSAEVLAIRPELVLNDREERERQQRYDLTTQFAELIDGSMTTEFELDFNGHDLIGEDGRGLEETTRIGLQEATAVVKANPNLWFEVRRRSFEREEFEELIKMASGEGPNTMVVVSDFPAELMDATEDVGGYNTRRQQTMMRLFFRRADGTMLMYSQSLDGSS